ncbi:protease modulator HflC [Wenxinia saemankumensis]|uniref:Protease FtsH subunit HflC n=1 Tax=Wenxinia saemankumensis TaxID=1447782 RepID=A0A1M6CH12_9RHOB|nr:protease modulator HflC [Wenxinia saemankumensis]SHI60297.1 protease FtsH subunit HflC [Wenxinia saemankumensis]
MNKSIIILPLVVILIALGLSSIFVVDEREKALVLQFGQIVRVQEEPGLGFKIPLVQEVVSYDDRILALDTPEIEVTPSDDRRLSVDAFARYRIADVVRFRQAVGIGGVRVAEDRLTNILNAQIREVLGADQVTSDTILSEDRRTLMNRIRDQAREQALSLGIDVVDVRLKQTMLPDQNLDATFARMEAERQREAADEIARGNEAAQRVRALADRTVTETLSEANRDADITRGEADAQANGIFASAYGADPEFFDFYRSMQAYELALQGRNSTMVLTPDSSFFDYLYDGDRPAQAPTPGTSGGAVEGETLEPGELPEEAQVEGTPPESSPAQIDADEQATSLSDESAEFVIDETSDAPLETGAEEDAAGDPLPDAIVTEDDDVPPAAINVDPDPETAN